jgi:hypothetical protein
VTRWLLEFANDDGVRGLVRLEVASDRARYWTYVVGLPDIDGIIAVRDDDVPRPRQGLEIRADGLWAELWCEQPHEHWTFGLEAFGLRVDAVSEEIGDRVAVGLDLEWEVGADGPPLGIVHGEILVERERFTITAAGSFDEGDAAPADDAALERWANGGS